jgi:hypothetical protein
MARYCGDAFIHRIISRTHAASSLLRSNPSFTQPAHHPCPVHVLARFQVIRPLPANLVDFCLLHVNSTQLYMLSTRGDIAQHIIRMTCRGQIQQCCGNSPGISKKLQLSNRSQPLPVRQTEWIRSYPCQRGRRFQCTLLSHCRSSFVPRSKRLSPCPQQRQQQLLHSSGVAVPTRLHLASKTTLPTMFPGGINDTPCRFPGCETWTNIPHEHHPNQPYQEVTEGFLFGTNHIFTEPDNYGPDLHGVGNYTDSYFAKSMQRQDTSSSGGTKSSDSGHSHLQEGYQSTPNGFDHVDHHENMANTTLSLPISQGSADSTNDTPTDATGIYICPHCPKKFKGPSAHRNRHRHERCHCPGTLRKILLEIYCECGERFSRKDSLKRHRKFSCETKKG